MKINLDELSGPIDSVLLRHRNWLFHYDHLDRTPQFRPDHKYDDLILDVERHLKKVSHFIDDSDDNETSTPADQTRLRIGLRNEYVQDSLPEMFRHFITPSMIAQIVTHTNRAIERSKDGKSLLTEAEMYAFIGLRLLIAANNDKQNKLWRVGINQKRMYTGILSRNRYAYLNIKMEFTGHKERRSAITPPFAMKFFYDEFGAQCRRVYKPTGDMLVSNIRYDFENNINLTNNIKSLPSPNQSFMWILSDNNRRYISDVKLCYGKQYGMSKNESSNKRVVKQLVQPFRHRKRKFAYHLESGLFWAHFASSKATRFDRQRWAHSMFFALVDFAVINTLTCCKLNGTLPHSIQTWSEYLKLLACELVYPWVLERVPVGSSKYRRYPDVAGGAEDIVEFLNKFRSKRNQVRLRKCLNEKQDESSSDTAAPSTSQPEKSNVSNIFSDASSSSSDFSESEMDDDGDKFLKQDLEENESEKKDASITTERLTRSNSVNVAYHSSHNNLHHWFRKRPEDVKTDALMINEGMKRPAPKWQPKHEPEWEPKAPDWTQCSISLPVQAKSEIVQIDLSDEGNGSISGETNESPTGPMSSPLLSSLKISRLSCITYPEQANRNQPSDGSNSVTTNIVSSSVGKACFFCSQDDMTAPSKRTKYSTCCTNCYKYVCSNHVQIIYKCIDCCEN